MRPVTSGSWITDGREWPHSPEPVSEAYRVATATAAAAFAMIVATAFGSDT